MISIRYLCFCILTFTVSINAQDNPYFIQKLNNPATYSVSGILNGPESICGNDDLQEIEYYDNGYNQIGFDFNSVQVFGASVGALKQTNNPNATSYCSGTLIAEDLFLTASHCVDNGTVNDFVAFAYQTNSSTGNLRTSQFILPITAILEDGVNSGLDYAILQLGGTPGFMQGGIPGATNVGLGWKDFSHLQNVPADALIIQHPNGEEKQLDAGVDIFYQNNRIRYEDIDTRPGSSGSGILNDHGELVGVHTNGGCTANGGNNSGVFAADIRAVSDIITATAPVTNVDLHLRLTGWTDIEAPEISGLFSFSSSTLYNHEVDKDNNSRAIRWTRPSNSTTEIEYLVDFGPTGRTAGLNDTQWTLMTTIGGSSTRPQSYLQIASAVQTAAGSSSLLPYLPRSGAYANATEYVKIHFRLRNIQGGNPSPWRYLKPIWYYYND